MKEFYDPHPGLLGCSKRLPEPVRSLAADLDGQRLAIEDVVQRLQNVAPSGYSVKDCPQHNMITMESDQVSMQAQTHTWRVLRYR